MEQQIVTTDGPCFENLPVEIQQLIFRYCGARTRREITLVCKDWAEKLQYFHEDFRVYLNNCYLREDVEPVSLLMNSSRRCQSLYLGYDIHTTTTEMQTRFFSHLGREVQDLEISWMIFKDPNFLLFFPKLKKLTISDLDSLRHFKSFPNTLEHVHLQRLRSLSSIEDFQVLRKIKNLNLLTSDKIFWEPKLEVSSRIYTFDENLEAVFESISPSLEIYLKYNENILDAPAITFDDVSELSFHSPVATFFSFNKFPHLRSICIHFWGAYGYSVPCFNFHQAVLCAGVTELKITYYRQSCIECFKSMIDSLPNLKKIQLGMTNHMTNEHVKYIFSKLPNLIHLETDSENLNHEIIFGDQSEHLIGNLMQLESLILPYFNVSNVLIHWPPMPNLKNVQFRALRDRDDHGLTNFTEKTPNLESFEVGEGSQLSDTAIEIIAKNWPKLRKLGLDSTKLCDLSPIGRFCRNLRTLQLRSRLVYTNVSFFDEIPTLWEITKGELPPTYRYLEEYLGWIINDIIHILPQ